MKNQKIKCQIFFWLWVNIIFFPSLSCTETFKKPSTAVICIIRDKRMQGKSTEQYNVKDTN